MHLYFLNASLSISTSKYSSFLSIDFASSFNWIIYTSTIIGIIIFVPQDITKELLDMEEAIFFTHHLKKVVLSYHF